MHILITGGAGYIGSHMVRYLLEKGCKISVLDNLSTGHADTLPSTINFHKADLLRKEDIDTCFSLLPPIEAVLHFAGRSIASESMSNPELYHLNNTVGTLNLLEVMQAHQLDKILFSSTAAVYGTPKIVPIPESHDTLPINPYGQSKLAAESALKSYAIKHGFSVICLRYFNAAGCAYGLQERHHPETHLIPLSVQAAMQGLEMPVYGNDYSTPDGSCVRDYVHVLDLCHAHYLALNALLKHEGFQVYNLGTQHGSSVMEVLKMTEYVCGQSIKTKLAPRRAGDPPILIADSRLAQQALGWKTQYSNLTQIIIDTWNSFKE